MRRWARQAEISGRYEPEAQENTELISEENTDKNLEVGRRVRTMLVN